RSSLFRCLSRSIGIVLFERCMLCSVRLIGTFDPASAASQNYPTQFPIGNHARRGIRRNEARSPRLIPPNWARAQAAGGGAEYVAASPVRWSGKSNKRSAPGTSYTVAPASPTSALSSRLRRGSRNYSPQNRFRTLVVIHFFRFASIDTQR